MEKKKIFKAGEDVSILFNKTYNLIRLYLTKIKFNTLIPNLWPITKRHFLVIRLLW